MAVAETFASMSARAARGMIDSSSVRSESAAGPIPFT